MVAELQHQLKSYWETNQDAYFSILEQMVGINSFTANAAGVNALAKYTVGCFAPLGFEAEMIDSMMPNYGKHLVLTRPGKSGRRIGLVSHLDTVFPPEEEARNDFAWRIEGDRAYGPGTVDIKGGTVLIYMILSGLKEHVPEVFEDVTWVVLLDASEEAEAEDFGRLCLDRLGGPDTLACLIFESGFMSAGHEFLVVRARKGMATFRLRVEGKAAHAGTSHKNGANAIVQLADVIQKVAAITDYEQDITVNVGVVSGGTVTNRVPHQAEAYLEMRAYQPEIHSRTIARIRALAGNEHPVTSAEEGFACRVGVDLLRTTRPWPRNEATDRLLAIWQEAADSLGYRVVPEERGGLSDGNHFWHVLPSLDGLGVSGGNAHCSERSSDGSKDQEYCTLSSFVPKALLNTVAILKLVGQGNR